MAIILNAITVGSEEKNPREYTVDVEETPIIIDNYEPGTYIFTGELKEASLDSVAYYVRIVLLNTNDSVVAAHAFDSRSESQLFKNIKGTTTFQIKAAFNEKKTWTTCCAYIKAYKICQPIDWR